MDNGQVGFLKEVYRNDAIFMPLELNLTQKFKAENYIKIRDTYHQLYNYEATQSKENAELRQSLNEQYDTFVKKYGHFNDRKNHSLIRMDAGSNEILSLERAVPPSGNLPPSGGLRGAKADIFNQPVAFNPNEITQVDTSIEALSASLNKFGNVNMEYMQSLVEDKNSSPLNV